jgi:GNAT superfamily N-acetyltransferase
LALASWRAFDHDVNYGAPGKGGPHGYKNEILQATWMHNHHYFKIVTEYRIIGGFIVVQKGGWHYELMRMFIIPEFQNQGIGTRAIVFMEQTFSDARRWTLNTPQWNQRTQHFYEKLGYVRLEEDGTNGWRYEKLRP